jgi:putative FmdB family regulatory protein
MPVYQYLCPSCNYKFELRQGFDADCKMPCPKCNNGARRIFVPVPVFFRGSGFYVTDNCKKSEIQDSPKELKTEQKSEIKDTTKEPKPEKKVETPAAKAS